MAEASVLPLLCGRPLGRLLEMPGQWRGPMLERWVSSGAQQLRLCILGGLELSGVSLWRAFQSCGQAGGFLPGVCGPGALIAEAVWRWRPARCAPWAPKHAALCPVPHLAGVDSCMLSFSDISSVVPVSQVHLLHFLSPPALWRIWFGVEPSMNVAREGPEPLLSHREQTMNEFGLGMAAGPWPGFGPYSGAKDSSPR